MEENCHFVACSRPRNAYARLSPRALGAGKLSRRSIVQFARRRLRPVHGVSSRGVVDAAKSVQPSSQAFVPQVPMYCFRFGKCGTFMPLSAARKEFRIAVVRIRFVSVFFAISEPSTVLRRSIAGSQTRITAAALVRPPQMR